VGERGSGENTKLLESPKYIKKKRVLQGKKEENEPTGGEKKD